MEAKSTCGSRCICSAEPGRWWVVWGQVGVFLNHVFHAHKVVHTCHMVMHNGMGKAHIEGRKAQGGARVAERVGKEGEGKKKAGR